MSDGTSHGLMPHSQGFNDAIRDFKPGDAVDSIIGTMADNNILIDELLTRSHNIISHQGLSFTDSAVDLSGVDDNRFYNNIYHT